MKKTDLEKNKGQKILGKIQQGGTPARFAGAAPLDRREQRRIDQALGLIPFAVKLKSDLVQRIHAYAAEHQLTLNDAVGALMEAGLGGGTKQAAKESPKETPKDAPSAPPKAAAKKTAPEPARETPKAAPKAPPKEAAKGVAKEAAKAPAKPRSAAKKS